MELICTLEKLKKALHNCERITAKQNTLQILNNVLIEATKGKIIFSATNLEMGVVVNIGAKINKEGSITIPIKTLVNFVNNLPKDNENIKISTNNQEMKVESKNSKAIIKGIVSDEFPLIPKQKSDYIFKIKNDDLRDVINKTIGCVSLNDVRAELTGVNCSFSEDKLFFASTDSFRLVEIILNLSGDLINEDSFQSFIEKNDNIIIPANTLIELNRILQNIEEDYIEIGIEDGQIFFQIKETFLVSRLIDGKYPEYKHIMPNNFQTRIVTEKDGLQKLIKVSSVFSNNKNQEIGLKIDSKDKKLLIEGKSVESGENLSEIKLDVQGPSLEVALNARYLLDSLNNINTNQVAILFNDSFSPVGIKMIDEKTGEVLDGLIYIIMPIKNV